MELFLVCHCIHENNSSEKILIFCFCSWAWFVFIFSLAIELICGGQNLTGLSFDFNLSV